MYLSQVTSLVGGSKTSGARSAAQELRARGISVANFAAGELDFAPPAEVVAATERALRADTNRYTDTAGIAELREALSVRTTRLGGPQYPASEFMLTTGAKHGLFLACLALLDPGDEALIPSPHWGTFAAQVAMVRGRPVLVETSGSGFVPEVALLEAARTDRTRMLILNSPNNPTGAVYSQETLQEITSWAVVNDVWIVFDECYRELVEDGVHAAHPVSLVPQARDRVVSVNSFSKSFAVTGWRAGYVYGPPSVVSAMKHLQSHTTSHVSSVLQHGLLPAAQGMADGFQEEVRITLARRRGMVARALDAMPGLSYRMPQGAFYFFVDVSGLLGGTVCGQEVCTTEDLVSVLMRESHVGLTPGSAFGSATHVRLSYAIEDEEIAAGLERMAKVVADAG